MGVAEAGGWSIPELSGQQTEFRVSLGSLVRSCLTKKKQDLRKGLCMWPRVQHMPPTNLGFHLCYQNVCDVGVGRRPPQSRAHYNRK